MPSRSYLLQQAEMCLRLSRATTDADMARKLADLAAEYQQKATAEKDDPPPERQVGRRV